MPEPCVIRVHLRELSQLLETLDPSPFRERDLDPAAEEYIVESVKELASTGPCVLVIHVDHPSAAADEERVVGDAIRMHFARRSSLLRRNLRQLLQRGVLSLGIGFIFLALMFVIVQATGLVRAETGMATLLRESLVIVGWVAMWRPLEIFLYDWWPIVGERRLHDRLSRIDVQIKREVA
jgi:hypothetical protein